MQRNLERTIWIAAVAIMMLGLMALYSASSQNVRVTQGIFYDQLMCALLGFFVMFFLSRFDYRKFSDVAYVLYIADIILLIMVLVIGRHILGARRWIEVGDLNFQPSEVTKLILILVLSRYFSQQKSLFSTRGHSPQEMLIYHVLIPFLLTLVPMLLVFKQPDLGTAILIFGIFLTMLFINGVRHSYILSFLGICLAMLPAMWHVLKTYQKERLMVFLNPNMDPLGAGYTIIQSKIAVGSGGLFGRGWLAGTQNQLNFLPERHTDFIFSVIGEEWGLFGALLLLACYFVLIDSGLMIAQQTKDRFGFSLAAGITSILALQVIVNIGMVLGLFPVVGITLPLVSYGRSSFLTFVMMVGLLLNLNRKRTIF